MTKVFLPMLLTLTGLLAALDSHAQKTPSDVYQLMLSVEAEVELIRLEMGIVSKIKPDFAVSDAQPREVYFQALTLFDKANRLMFEQIREREVESIRQRTNLTPSDVFQLVERSLAIILRVKESLRISEDAKVETLVGTRTPTDGFKLIVRTNRVLNRLLDQRFAPAEVYQQLTYGVGLTSSILGTVTSSGRLGTEPRFVRRKTPADVYGKLISIYLILHETMMLSGEKSLLIDPAELAQDHTDPSDVYDMASLLIAELSYLHSLRPNAAPPRKSYYPGTKLPSDAYQRAGRLESQISALQRYVTSNPGWLGNL